MTGRHVVHVYKDYAPVVGGVENHVRLLAEAQAAAGYRVTVLTTAPRGPGGLRREADVDVVRARRLATVASTPLSPSLVARMGGLEADLWHLHSPYPVAELGWLRHSRRPKAHPMVLTYHSDVVRQRLLGRLWAPLLRRVLAGADRVLATSPRYAETSPFLRRVGPDRLRVVPLGIPDPLGQGGADPAGVAARLQSRRDAGRARHGDGPLLAFVGQLRYYKGLDTLLDAMALDGGGAARLLVVGSGPLEAQLRARAEALGLAGRVCWLGGLSDADRDLALAAGDVYVLPAVARSEAFGLNLLEAMAAGLPLVSTEIGTGTSWVNQDGVTGRVVPPADPPALARAIAEMLADPSGLAAMGRAARRRFEAAFTAERMVRAVDAVYAEVLA